MNYKQSYQNYLQQFEFVLQNYCTNEPKLSKKLSEAMQYSLTAGGKRIRPVIALATCQTLGGNADRVLNGALALEMVHTYSLIHDDLPCMDNDDFRRGKSSCHKAFDEATAVLAGDGLLTEAFAFAAKAEDISPEAKLSAISVLAQCAGVKGMIGGQIIDISSEGKEISYEKLLKLYAMKTGALIVAAAKIGCILAGAADKLEFAEKYAQNVGLAFQIVDDILDKTADEKVLGKPLHSDEKNNKTTYLSFKGIEESKKIVVDLSNQAKECIDKIGEDGTFLKQMADYLAIREN